MNFQRNYQRLLNTLVALVFGLLLLGNLVRNMKAGLSCPDWPLCYGKIIPYFNPLIYYEFSHRVLAGLISFIFLFLFVKAIQYKLPRRLILTFVIAGGVLVFQIALGALTVLKLLDSNIVAMHLITGVSFFLLISYIKIQFHHFINGNQQTIFKKSNRLFFMSCFMFLLLFIQSFLGGLVASNYAGLACQGFPTCNGDWWPVMEGSIFIQMIHRIVAFIIIGFAVYFYILYKRFHMENWFHKNIKSLSKKALLLLSAQILVGISNIYLAIPTLLSILHLGLAALLLVVFLKLSLELAP